MPNQDPTLNPLGSPSLFIVCIFWCFSIFAFAIGWFKVETFITQVQASFIPLIWSSGFIGCWSCSQFYCFHWQLLSSFSSVHILILTSFAWVMCWMCSLSCLTAALKPSRAYFHSPFLSLTLLMLGHQLCLALTWLHLHLSTRWSWKCVLQVYHTNAWSDFFSQAILLSRTYLPGTFGMLIWLSVWLHCPFIPHLMLLLDCL